MPGIDAGAADAGAARGDETAAAGSEVFTAVAAALARTRGAATATALTDARGDGEAGCGETAATRSLGFGAGACDGDADADGSSDGLADADGTARGDAVARSGVAAGLGVAGRSVASGASVAGATVGVAACEGTGERSLATSCRVVTRWRASESPAPITKPRMTMPMRNGTSGNDESFGGCGERRERRGGVSFIASRIRFAQSASMREPAIPARSRTTFEKMRSQRKRSRGS
jgi:hypothetical protein